MLQEAPPGVGIKSGWRSTERQAQIFAAHGNNRHVAARPGHSNHEHGLAADLSFDSPEAKRWVHQNAARFGLHFRMGHEPWHIEPIEATADDTHWGRG